MPETIRRTDDTKTKSNDRSNVMCRVKIVFANHFNFFDHSLNDLKGDKADNVQKLDVKTLKTKVPLAINVSI